MWKVHNNDDGSTTDKFQSEKNGLIKWLVICKMFRNSLYIFCSKEVIRISFWLARSCWNITDHKFQRPLGCKIFERSNYFNQTRNPNIYTNRSFFVLGLFPQIRFFSIRTCPKVPNSNVSYLFQDNVNCFLMYLTLTQTLGLIIFSSWRKHHNNAFTWWHRNIYFRRLSIIGK